MHELSIVLEVLNTVDSIMVENKLKEVKKITLEVGPFSSVLPEYIRAYWPMAVDGTKYKNTSVEIEILKAIGKCLDCGEENIDLVAADCICPKCKSYNLKIESGREFRIKNVEGY